MMPSTGNADFAFDDLGIMSLTRCEAPVVATSAEIDERLAPLYERVGTRPGLLESVAGIVERRYWPEDVSFTDAATMAGQRALEESGVPTSRIGLVIDTSVCRKFLEPSSTVSVHAALDLPPTCINFDLSNACLGFLNGIQVAGAMIKSGVVEYALIVDGEGSRELHENTIRRLLADDATTEDLFESFASLTLGSGATAAVLGPHSAHPASHRVLGGFFRADTVHHELCVGSLDGMVTDTAALLEAATKLASTAWSEIAHEDWRDQIDHYILHQVSKVHTQAIVTALDLPPDRIPTTFPMFGNIGPSSIPFTLASIADDIAPDDRVLCLGIGSGLNVAAIELIW
jgi:3-oxoacyl-[acyl-carrier-protein] synthase-3